MKSLLSALVCSAAFAAPYPIKRSADQFYVGTTWPTVPFKVPESWAGLLPITEASGENSTVNELFFWYFREEESGSKDDLVFWLNGGPGCSSLEGLLEENGPVLFPYNISGQPDQPYVKLNPYGWNKAASVVWVDQPIGTGLSTGDVDAKSYRDVAKEFFSFLEKFYAVFPENRNKKLWITGESAGGMFIPYIADYIYNNAEASHSAGINLKGISMNDPSFTGTFFGTEAAVVPFVQKWQKELRLNDLQLGPFYLQAKIHGYYDYVEKNLVYPPPDNGLQIPSQDSSYSPWEEIYYQVEIANSYFNAYNVNQSVKIDDPLGFSPSHPQASTHNIINDIPGFKKMLHATNKTWEMCASTVFAGTPNDPSPDVSVLPGVIEKSERSLIQHGMNDFVLLANGSALAIQNMTWGGSRGFQNKPTGLLRAGGRDAGTYHSERGLTFVTVSDSGHMIPQDRPEVALKNLKYLLGQISYNELGDDI